MFYHSSIYFCLYINLRRIDKWFKSHGFLPCIWGSNPHAVNNIKPGFHLIAGSFLFKKSGNQNKESEVSYMAYWIHKAGTSTRPNYRFFYMDSDESVSELPTATTDGVKQSVDSSAHNVCSIGSKALSLSTSTIYKLDSNNKWVAQSSSSGSSSGGGQSAYQVAVEYGFEGSVEEWLASLHGQDGEDGADGKAATIKVGQVTTVDPDVDASVVNTGTETNALFDFSIPKGQSGTNGSDGYSPTIVENAENTDGIYKLDVTTKEIADIIEDKIYSLNNNNK